jgi:hypothetical protein
MAGLHEATLPDALMSTLKTSLYLTYIYPQQKGGAYLAFARGEVGSSHMGLSSQSFGYRPMLYYRLSSSPSTTRSFRVSQPPALKHPSC